MSTRTHTNTLPSKSKMRPKFFLVALLATLPTVAFAAPSEYLLLAPLPGLTEVSLTEYLEGAVTVTIGLAGILAVVMTVICGIQMIGSPSVSQKSASKQCITSALFGLLLAISSWVILNTINDQLLSSDIGLIAVPVAAVPPPLPPPVVPPAPPAPPVAGTSCWKFTYNLTSCGWPEPPSCQVGVKESEAWPPDSKSVCEMLRGSFSGMSNISNVSAACYTTTCL
jgi:hypothetical protein